MVRLFKELIKNEGIKAFYKGFGSRTMVGVSYSIIWLPVYEYFKSRYGVKIDLEKALNYN